MKKYLFLVVVSAGLIWQSCEKEPLLLPDTMATVTQLEEGISGGSYTINPSSKVQFVVLKDYLQTLIDKQILPPPDGMGTMDYVDGIERALLHNFLPEARNNLEGLVKHLVYLEAKQILPTPFLITTLDLCDQLEMALRDRTYFVKESFENYPVGQFPYAGNWKLATRDQSLRKNVVTNEEALYGENALQLIGTDRSASKAALGVPDVASEVFFIAHINTERLSNSVNNSRIAGLGFASDIHSAKQMEYAYLEVSPNYRLYIRSYGVLPSYIYQMTPANWYRIKMRFDMQTRTTDVWVNGQLVLENGNVANVENFVMCPYLVLESGDDGTTRSYFDRIELWY